MKTDNLARHINSSEDQQSPRTVSLAPQSRKWSKPCLIIILIFSTKPFRRILAR